MKAIPIRWWAERKPNDITEVNASTPLGDTAQMKFTGWHPGQFDTQEKRVKFMDLLVRLLGATLYHKTQQRMELAKKPRP